MRGGMLAGALIAVLVLSGCVHVSSEISSKENAELTSAKEDKHENQHSDEYSEILDWGTDFNRAQLMNYSLEVAENYFSQNSGIDGAVVTFIFEDSISDSRRSKVRSLAESTVSAFHEHVPSELVVIGGTTQKFMSETIQTNNIEVPPDGNQGSLCGILIWEDSPSGCTWQNVAWLGFGQEPEREIHALNNFVPHELFHNIQANLANGTETTRIMPSWFLEGSAEFIGYAMADHTGYFSYAELAFEDWHYLPNPATGLAFWATPPPSRSIPFENYMMGQIATEYLVSNVGMDGLLNIFSFAGQGMRFDKAFEEAVGISLTKFYATFDIAYQRMLQKDTGEFRTFENRLCPEKYGWNCEIDNYRGLAWWQLEPVSVELPPTAENRGHEIEINSRNDTYPLGERGCEELLSMLEFKGQPVAAGFEYADLHLEQTGQIAAVSTQWYVRNSLFDTNKNGVLCDPADDESWRD